MKRISVLLLVLITMLGLVSCTDDSYYTYPKDFDPSNLPYESYLSDENPVVVINVKNYGEIVLQLFPDVAENTVNNFIKYAQDGDYINSTFHRVIENFMIQGGMVDETNCAIEGEFSNNGVTNNLPHYRGVISMARTSIMDSATSQFFIVHETSPHLDGSYAAFGAVVIGFDVLDSIASVNTGLYDAPVNSVIISSVEVYLGGFTSSDVICN